MALPIWVLLFIHLVSGALVWCFSPLGSNHIGISGIIYGIAAFLIASGFMRQHRNHIAIAIFVALSYGGMVIGFIPVEGVSWQSHVFGAWSGALAAWLLSCTGKLLSAPANALLGSLFLAFVVSLLILFPFSHQPECR